MKLALIHDWINEIGGAERVLIDLHKIFPEAPIYTLFLNKKTKTEFLPDATIFTSPLQKIPFITKIYKYLFFLMPSAVESFDLSNYDIVISSSVTFSKGIVLKPKTRHICYCYSPTRFLWDRNADYKKTGLGRFASHFLRIWDRQASDRVGEFIAISKNVQSRIKKYYQRESKVIYPPAMIKPEMINIKSEEINNKNFYLIVSRLYDYKNINIAIEAFNKLGFELVIIGDGPAIKKLKKSANKNIEFLGYQDDGITAWYYQNCKAFIMPQEEDFGLTAIETMGFGKPVLALHKGGALETIIEGITGEFFDDPIPEALADGVRRLNENYERYSPIVIRKWSEKFSRERFKNDILNLINENHDSNNKL